MPKVEKIPTGVKGWRWKVTTNEGYIIAELQRNIFIRWVTFKESKFYVDMIKRPYKVNEDIEYWFKPEFDLHSRLHDRWKDYCKTHKVS